MLFRSYAFIVQFLRLSTDDLSFYPREVMHGVLHGNVAHLEHCGPLCRSQCGLVITRRCPLGSSCASNATPVVFLFSHGPSVSSNYGTTFLSFGASATELTLGGTPQHIPQARHSCPAERFLPRETKSSGWSGRLTHVSCGFPSRTR